MKQTESFDAMLWQLPGVVVLKNRDSVWQACSAEAASVLFGVKNDTRIQGLTDADMPGQAAELAGRFVARDQKVMLSGCTISSIDINSWADHQTRALLSHKKPYLDTQGNIIGTIFNATELSGQLLAMVYQLIMENLNYLKKDNRKTANYVIGGEYDDAGLTKRESECLFYTIRGETARQIADRLRRSRKTIEVHIEHIKEKFNCRKKTELVGKAIERGFLYSIPTSFLPVKQQSMELTVPTINTMN